MPSNKSINESLTIPTQTSTLSHWLNYMQQIHVTAIDMGLSRVLPVAEALGLLQSAKQDAFVFTVAGTNGKGSTTAVISEICQQAGYKTALYQSPHLIDFNERVRINGKPVGDTVLVNAFCAVEQARLKCELTLSFFEMTTLAAMLIFAEADCDVWVLEVGLGGRLDVVNIIDADVAVITNVGIDHVDWLGDTREKIGFEKAGILREDIPLIYGETDMPKSVQDKINKQKVNCYHFGKDYFFTQLQPTKNALSNTATWQYSNAAITLQLPVPTLSLLNTATAISAVLASSLVVNPIHISHAMQNVKLAGRLDERALTGRYWLFDVAHNAHGMNFVLPQILAKWQAHKQKFAAANLHVVFSMLADKPIAEVVDGLVDSDLPIVKWHIAEIDFIRAADIEVLKNQVLSQVASDKVMAYANLAQATKGAVNQSNADDYILVCGSFHTIAEVLIALGAEAVPS